MTEPSREDRLNLIVALAVKNKTHPNKNNFVSFVRRIYASKFNLSVAQTRAELDILVKAYQAERWKTLLKDLPYELTEKELEEWQTC